MRRARAEDVAADAGFAKCCDPCTASVIRSHIVSTVRHGEIRQALHARLRVIHADEPDTVYRNELGLQLGRSRVDVAAINGRITGYEIKGAHDSLVRLPAQVAAYSAVLDRAAVVAEPKYIRAVTSRVPRWWAIWMASPVGDDVLLEEIRSGRPNPGQEPLAVAQLLWREEALGLLIARDAASGLRNATRWRLWEALLKRLPFDELKAEVRHCLKVRPEWPGGL